MSLWIETIFRQYTPNQPKHALLNSSDSPSQIHQSTGFSLPYWKTSAPSLTGFPDWCLCHRSQGQPLKGDQKQMTQQTRLRCLWAVGEDAWPGLMSLRDTILLYLAPAAPCLYLRLQRPDPRFCSCHHIVEENSRDQNALRSRRLTGQRFAERSYCLAYIHHREGEIAGNGSRTLGRDGAGGHFWCWVAWSYKQDAVQGIGDKVFHTGWRAWSDLQS